MHCGDRMDATLEVGTLCRSKAAIMRFDSDDQGRLCRVVGVVPEERRHHPAEPEYKVELLAAPVTAFRRASDLEIVLG